MNLEGPFLVAPSPGFEDWRKTYPVTVVTPYVDLMHMTEYRFTRWGREFIGLPVDPRPSRGWRRHVRKMKRKAK